MVGCVLFYCVGSQSSSLHGCFNADHMKILFYLLLSLHGLIHLLGFLKAFQIAEFEGLTLPISRPVGALWLLAFGLFGFALLQEIRGGTCWWMAGLLAVILSQILIVLFWQDAKFGTIPNVIILLVSLVGWFSYQFSEQVDRERTEILAKSEQVGSQAAEQYGIVELPEPVQRWLHFSGALETEPIKEVHLAQSLRIKLKPEQEDWFPATAEQAFTLAPPAFVWSVEMNTNPLLVISGRDRFADGKGAMLMKLFSTIPVVQAEDNEKLNQAALQRYLAEIVWFPSAALQPYIEWEYRDESSAKATMTYGGTTGSGTFYFDEKGAFVQFVALRYKEVADDSPAYEWVIDVLGSNSLNGVQVPVKLRVTWRLDELDWTWLELELTNLQYEH